MKKLFSSLALIALAGVLFTANAAQPRKAATEKALPIKENPDPWLLAAREGECAPISILAKKGPEYSDIQSPYQLAEKLNAAGDKAEIKEFKTASRPAVEVRAPSVGLAVMFVKKEFCDKPAPAPEKK